MAVITYLNQKGGSGKTTATIHCAYWLCRKGKSVLVVDSDAQRSSSQWIKGMKNPIPCKVLDNTDSLLEELPILASHYDFVLVDAPAGLAETSRAILLRSDLAAIPVQPTGVDLRSAGDAIRLLKQAQSVRGGKPHGALFLSRAVKGTRLKTEAIELLEKSGVPLLKAVIHQKQVVADCSGQSCTVWEMASRAGTESGGEFQDLFQEVLGNL